jgi:hypothetical protein
MSRLAPLDASCYKRYAPEAVHMPIMP